MSVTEARGGTSYRLVGDRAMSKERETAYSVSQPLQWRHNGRYNVSRLFTQPFI